MRTTLTLDPDVADALKERMGQEGIPFKQLVNDLLRRGMTLHQTRDDEKENPFRVQAHQGSFKPGVDLLKLNQLVDDLEANAFVAEMGEGKDS